MSLTRRLALYLTFGVVAGWCAGSVARAQSCDNDTRCEQGAFTDLVLLRDGSFVCGMLMKREEGRQITVVTATETRAIAWDTIACMRPGPGRSRVGAIHASPRVADPSPAITPEQSLGSPAGEGFALDWDLRLLGTGMLKRYKVDGTTSGSWSAGGGIGLGAALRYQTRAKLGSGGARFYAAELGLSANISFESWHQLGGSSAPLIHQDVSLVLGGRVALGSTRLVADAQQWSGVMLGLAWLPTYVDFYGHRIDSRSKVNPAGVRLTVDIGRVSFASWSHPMLLRIALGYLPYVGRLPTAFWLSAGLLFY